MLSFILCLVDQGESVKTAWPHAFYFRIAGPLFLQSAILSDCFPAEQEDHLAHNRLAALSGHGELSQEDSSEWEIVSSDVDED